MWHTFGQNNSGGYFKGPARLVCVEGGNVDNINTRAIRIGLYFGGRNDCPCCGDRWIAANGDLDEEPLIYGSSPDKHNKYLEGSSVLIVPLKGKKRWVNKPE